MSALVERLIAARDGLRTPLAWAEEGYGASIREARQALADAANRIVELERSLKIADEKSHDEPLRHRASFGMDE